MECKNILGMSFLGLTCLVGAQSALAQVALKPQAIPFESFVLVPTLNTRTVFDDNIYSLDANEVSSFSQVVNPNFTFLAQDRLNVYQLFYNLNAAGFANDSNDSYNDHKLGVSAHLEPSVRLRYDAGLTYALLHDDRGTGASSGFGIDQIRGDGTAANLGMGEVDKFNLATISGGVEYGAKTARGSLVANGDINQKRYSRQSSADARDNDTVNVLLGLRARLMPKTTFLVDYEISDTNYDGASPDTKDNRILAGITWENAIQSTGKLRLGQSNRQIDGAADLDKFTWDLGLIWKPVALDTISINGGARASDGVNNTTIENTNYSVSWTHDWADRFNTTLSLGVSEDDYQGVVRTDESTSYGIFVNYQMRRWLVLSAGINSSDKDSTEPNVSNKRNVMSIGAQVSL